MVKKLEWQKHKNVIAQANTIYFVDVETNIGKRLINLGFEPEAISIGIAKAVNNQKPVSIFYREFLPIR